MYSLRHLASLALVCLLACKPAADEGSLPLNEETRAINRYVYDQMQDIYLWNDQIPGDVRPFNYETPSKLLDAMKFRLDRWSYVVKDDGATRRQLTTGESLTYGFLPAADRAQAIRVGLVYPDSPASEAGLVRGNRIVRVNGQEVAANNFPRLTGTVSLTIAGADGQTREVNVTPRSVNLKSVIHREVKQVAGRTVGYLVYQNFTTASQAELDDAFQFFRAQNVADLIIDLRYNPGGFDRTSQHFAGLLAPPGAVGRTYSRYAHNTRYASQNRELKIEAKPVNLNLRRVFFILTGNSASASEFLVNGLRPFLDVQVVGTRSVGKFFGAPLLEQGGYTFSPIVFQGVNDRGENFPEGIPPTFEALDDRTRNFGDERENLLAAVLHFIARGSYSGFAPSIARTEGEADGWLGNDLGQPWQPLPLILQPQ
jgi:C-terminal processing protease CtpA/Prc